MSEPTGFQLAPLKTEGRMYSYELGRELTQAEETVEIVRSAWAHAERAAFERSWRGRLAALRLRFKRAWAAFKDEDTGL
jgi:hypothetical protein